MKRLLLIVGILASLLLASCWPFDRYEGKRAISGTYDCTTDRLELHARTQKTPIIISSLMSSVQTYGLTDEGMFEVKRVLKRICTTGNAVNTSDDKVNAFFVNASYLDDASIPRAGTLLTGRNVLGRFDKKVTGNKITVRVYEVDPGDDAAAVGQFVSNKFKEPPCDPTSKRCVACRKSPGSYRWYCSIPNG